MNIWVIQVGEPISFIDGGSRLFRTEMLVNRLVERGHQVLRWTSTFDHMKKNFRFWDRREIELGSHLHYRFLHSNTPYRKNLSLQHARHDREIAMAFDAEASEESTPDLILCCIPPLRLGEVVCTYAHRHNVPLILDIRDIWPDSLLRHLPWYSRWLGEWILGGERRRAKEVLYHANALTSISREGLKWGLRQADRRRRDWDQIFPLAYEEAPKQIFANDDERLQAFDAIGATPADIVVTCIGRVGSAFNLDLVIRLAKDYWQEGHRQIKFVLAGEEPIYGFLQKKYAKLPNLKITGWLNQQQLQQLLAITDIGLLPYRNIHSPTLRNKPLDFFSMGIPILSSLKGEVAFLIRSEEIGLIFRSGDLISLRGALDSLLNDPEKRREMGKRALQIFHDQYAANRVYPAFVDYLEDFQRTHKTTPYRHVRLH